MASSIHMSHSLFCFDFLENEDIALSSDISNELRHNNHFCYDHNQDYDQDLL